MQGCGEKRGVVDGANERHSPVKLKVGYPTRVKPDVQALWDKNIRTVEAWFNGGKIALDEYWAATEFLESTTGITAHNDYSYGGRMPTERVMTEDVGAWKAWYQENAPFLVVDEKCGSLRVNHELRRGWIE